MNLASLSYLGARSLPLALQSCHRVSASALPSMLLQASKFTQCMSKHTRSMMKRLLKVVEHVLPVWGGGVHSKEQVEAYIADDRLPPWVIPKETASAKQLHDGLLLHDAKHDLARYAAGKDYQRSAVHQHVHVSSHTPRL